MFNRNKKLDEEITRLNIKIESILESHRIEVTRTKEELYYQIEKLKREHEDEMNRFKLNEDARIYASESELTQENSKLTVKTQTQQKEIEMYTKAFENLGFDVKDMKDILNKLVDGLIAKNEIKLVK